MDSKEYHHQYYLKHKEKWKVDTEEKKAKKAKSDSLYRIFRSDEAKKKEAARVQKRNADPKTKERKRLWYLANRQRLLDSGRERSRLYMAKKNSTLSGKILNRLRSRLWKALHRGGTKKIEKTIELIGCTPEELIVHLVGSFTEGMTVDDLFCGKIEIDHIKPCAMFDLTIPDQRNTCFHYSNLQPLWMLDNRRKLHHYASPPAPETSV
jgi:hypothetical protein